jgi:hypothetical protein
MSAPLIGPIGYATRVVDHGDPQHKWNLVVLGDGYKMGQLPTFGKHVKRFTDALRATPPFGANWSAINVFRIDVASRDSGAKNPKTQTCKQGTGTNPTTYFSATFCSPWGNVSIERLLTVDSGLAMAIATQLVPQAHQVLVLVNSRKYGGSGVAGVAACSMDRDAFKVAVHEMGHSAFDLADEYADPDVNPPAPTQEPIQPNITICTSRANLKWGLIPQGTPVPSWRNSDCGNFPNTAPPAGVTVGAFEGGGLSRCGVFRPSEACLMRHLGEPFCRVCSRVIEDKLKHYI